MKHEYHEVAMSLFSIRVLFSESVRSKILPMTALLIGIGGVVGLGFVVCKFVDRMAYLFPLILLGFFLFYALAGYGGAALLDRFAQ